MPLGSTWNPGNQDREKGEAAAAGETGGLELEERRKSGDCLLGLMASVTFQFLLRHMVDEEAETLPDNSSLL